MSLLPRTEIAPLPVDSSHYVAALQNKPGELDALAQVAPATWECLTPLIHIVGHLKPRENPLTADTVRERVKRIFDAVGPHPMYLDILRLDPCFPVATSAHKVPVLAQLYAAARKRGLRFIPVAHVGSTTTAHHRLVADAAAEDGCGVALRYKFLNAALPSGETHASLLTNALAATRCEANRADLLLDLDVLDPDDQLSVNPLARSVTAMTAAFDWRCVVLIGTTIPKMMSCIAEGTVGAIERAEWSAWKELRKHEMERMPAFGDYAVQHPHPPMEEGGGNTMRANVRYTIETETLVARGRGPVRIEGNEQYRELCQEIVAREEFCGRGYSWGDAIIADCADGTLKPGEQRMWRGAATSHHLRFVADQLRSLQTTA